MDTEGFITGILVTVFCGLVILFWGKIIVPWWQDRGYKGLRLDGTWNAEIQAKDGKFVFKLELSQKFHDLSGKLSITKSLIGDGSSQSELEIQGVYWESFLQLTGKSCVDNKLSFSVFLLKAYGRSRLAGIYSFRALNNDEILSHKISFNESHK